MDFEKEIESGIVLVDFYTPACMPCKRMAPILEECVEFVNVVKIDASEAIHLSSQYRISAVPTLVFFKDGVEVKRLVGLHGKEDIRKVVNEIQNEIQD